jgi:hypothetical protein
LCPILEPEVAGFVEHTVGNRALEVYMTTDRLSTLFESQTTHMSLTFGDTIGCKIEQKMSTTGADLAGVLDKKGGKIDGVVEQNCEAGAVEHGSEVLVVGVGFPPPVE